MVIVNKQRCADRGKCHLCGVEERVCGGEVLRADPFAFQHSPERLCDIQVRRVRRQIEDEEPTPLPYRPHLLYGGVPEFHIYSLSEHFGWKKEDAEENTIAFISNFINACELIKNEYPLFRGPKLKIHCNKGRSEFHKKELFRWFPKYWWDDYAILTEGLIACGRGKELQGTVKLSDDGPISHFLLPGVDFYNTPQTRRAVEYKTTDQKTLFLDDAPNSAVIMEGWWNLTNRIAKYEKIQLNHLCI